jgi:predicted metal-binding membrane protein
MAVQSKVFLAVSTLLFAVSAAVTVVWCASMSAPGGMPMPGGWTMSMAWMRMPGQTWLGSAASFLAMWLVMMVAMMLPSLIPTLWRYRQVVGAVSAAGAARLGRLTAVAGSGYFLVWAMVGLAVFPLGVALARMAMRTASLARAAPLAAGAVVLIAGALQFTAWKARQLNCCRETPQCRETSGWRRTPRCRSPLRSDGIAAWRYGVRLGMHCCCCCSGLTVSLLAIGVMDLRAMAIVTAAVNAERLAGERVARAIGAAVIGAGFVLIARGSGLA